MLVLGWVVIERTVIFPAGALIVVVGAAGVGIVATAAMGMVGVDVGAYAVAMGGDIVT